MLYILLEKAMERSQIKNVEIKVLLNNALTKQTDDREVYRKEIDVSYYYEGYNTFKAEELKDEESGCEKV